MENKILEVIIPALNLASIKQMVVLKEPLICNVGYDLQHTTDGLQKYPWYKIEGKGVYGLWSQRPVIYYAKDYEPTKDETTEILLADDSDGLKKLVTSGLAGFRTTLKYMHESKLLDLVGSLHPKDKKINEVMIIKRAINSIG